MEAVKAHVRGEVTRATVSHATGIAHRYAAEVQAVRPGNPGREDAAARAFAPIAQKIQTSLRTARSETINLII